MAEPVLYMRGFPQSLTSEPIPDALLDDLKVIIDLSDETLDKLYKNLSKAEGFLNPKTLLANIQKFVEKSSISEALRRIILSFRPTQVDQILTSLEKKRNEKDFPFDNEQLERLKTILKNLIRSYPSLARFQKAERLADITGQQMEEVELICDLRPIFDETRKNVEGMMPYTRLHIVATGEDGLPNAFEVEMSKQQVFDLAEKALKAKSKLETLCQSIERWVPSGLPDLPLTRIHRKEGSNA